MYIIIVIIVWCAVFLPTDCENFQAFSISSEMLSEFSLFMSPLSRYLVLHLYDLGFANRMRSLADFHKIALISKRKLLLSWIPSAACNARFQDLFDEQSDNIELIDLSFINSRDEEPYYDFVREASSGMNLTFLGLPNISSEVVKTNNMETFFIKSRIFHSDINVIMLSYNGALALENMPCQQYFSMQSAFYLSLKPVSQIRSIVSDILRTHFISCLMIGIHFRDHDPIHDWEIIPPPPNSNGEINSEGNIMKAWKFGEGASVEDFLRYMRLINNHFTTSNDDGDTTFHAKFFIASNNETIKRIFLTEFPTAITLFGNHDRMNLEGIQVAVIDWLLLSETAMIINTYGSSYSQEASRRKMIPLVRIYNSVLLFMDDVRLPKCGNIKFIKVSYPVYVEMIYNSTNQNGNGLLNSTHSYKEGTWDQREISGKLIEFQKTSVLADWGLSEVFALGD